MEQTMAIALEHAQKQGATQIHRMTLRIGDLSGVVPEALEFAFDVITSGTLAEGATLEIERVPVVCGCVQCGEEFTPEDIVYCCPQCGYPSAQILSGKEIELLALGIS